MKDIMKSRWFIALIVCVLFLTSCNTKNYDQGYEEGYNDGYYDGHKDAYLTYAEAPYYSPEDDMPLLVLEENEYDLYLIDAYYSVEEWVDSWAEEEMLEECYVFKFQLVNKHPTSNIRVALVDASINGYSLCGTSGFHSEDSFSVYTWSGNSLDNSAVDRFVLFYSDIESATNIRDADTMGSASLSFTFRAYVIDEMDGYGEDSIVTIEHAFYYC